MLQKSGFYEKMKELEDKTNKYLEDARDKFSLAFEDGNLTVEEKIKESLKKTTKWYKNYNCYNKYNGYI